MGLSTSSFFGQMGALFAEVAAGTLTPSVAATQFTTLAAQWVPLSASNPAIGAQQLQLLTLWQATPTEYSVWAAGTASGGFREDGTPSSGSGDALAGYYPVTAPGGSQVYIPSLARQASNGAAYDDTSAGIGATNFQQAIDILAARKLNSTAWTRLSAAAGTSQALPYDVATGEELEMYVGGARAFDGVDFTVSAETLTWLSGGTAAGESLTFRKTKVS